MTNPQKDFILFDDPAPSVPRGKASSPTSSANELSIPGPFTKHRSPRQSPFDDVASSLPDTLDDAGGPRRKRQRSEVYASSSSFSRSSREGSSGQASNERITPPDPPSGSLGAPMHELSLGESMPSRNYDPTRANAALASPNTAGMTREQQERVKAQIRAELAGVDTRAFKGPLRDILQKHDYAPRPNDMQTSPLSASSNPMQAGVAPSFSLFPDYELGGPSQRQSTQPSKRESQDRANGDDDMSPLPQRPADLRTRSSTFDGGFGAMSYPPARHSQNYLPDWARQSQSSQGSRDSNSQQQQQQQQQQRPHMPPPLMSQSQLAQRGGPVSMASTENIGVTVNGYSPDARRPLKRESSGLTVSPQEAFLDYDDVENALSHSGLGKMPSLFAAVPPGLSDAKPVAPRYPGAQSGTSTPRMTSQQNVPRARSSTGKPSYASRPVAMSRNDTARPHHYQNQKRPGPTAQQPASGRSPYPGQSDGRASASQESGSQSSLFSPVDSGDTISTDDDEDERPYYPPNMRPSMIRGGPSSLYLNYPNKADGRVSASPSAMAARPLLGKERTSSTGSGAWSHVRNEPWAFRQAHMSQPRFSDVSASSSDSEDDRSGRRGAYLQRQEAEYHSRRTAHPHSSHAHPHYHQYGHGHLHGHGGHAGHSQSPHSRYTQPDPRAGVHRPSLGQHQSSSEDVDDTDGRYSRAPYASSRMDDRVPRRNVPGALGGYGYIPGSQESGLSVDAANAPGAAVSHDEGSISPSIRSSAQTSDRRTKGSIAPGISAPPPLLTARPPTFGSGVLRPEAAGSSLPVKDDRVEASGEEEESETGTNSASIGGNESDYEDSPENAVASTKKAKPKTAKPRTSVGGGANSNAAAAATAGAAENGGGSNSNSTTTTTATKASALTAADGTTKCDYVSPITGVACQTAFHRPYDLARHRETIHAREEAGFMREGRLELEDCVVLGKEVDPKKSTAVVEWKCKTCGANFSRKDAMLRHERLRHNSAK
ncbi:uncharacterized protein SPSC_01004 [Sporisorium scitamineum]|uniref:C2H2-type domain-containing protein n=1 Tax=Sporisorium scitamineum TaxID=49012 RepID=A0A127Z8G0_9BASI|nr:uncharacterized protein SPSC_01004 [Sporisorium scitamineum]